MEGADGGSELSSWAIRQKDFCNEIVHLWGMQYYKVPLERKLCFLYLCNDIVQRSRGNGTISFIDRFTTVLPMAIASIMK